MAILTLNDFEFSGKSVLVRVDINCPVDDKGRISASDRIEGHAQTIKELAGKNAKVTVLAHQGRPGDPDFIHLEQHAKLLEKFVGRGVKYVDDVFGEKAKSAIRSLKNGEILLLDNVRLYEHEQDKLKPEEHAKGELVANLAPLFDYFVLDAFSAAHRAHASIVGFAVVLPSIAGRVMEREVNALSKVTEKPARPCVFVLGGAKPDDSVTVMEAWLSAGIMDRALACGTLANLCLIAKGMDLGEKTMKFAEEKQLLAALPKVKELVAKYGERIMVPIDVAYEENGKRREIGVAELPVAGLLKDIGSKTAEAYAKEIATAKTIVINGPAGVYEEKNFELGTKTILKAIEGSKGFSVAGGGHTLSAMEKFGIEKKKIAYISLAGKALIEFLCGKKLPGVEALKASAAKFKAKK